MLTQQLRAVDVVARYGGEEFAVVLPETNVEGALCAAEKIRAVLETHAFPHGRLTASLGVVVCAPSATDASPAALIAMADQSLYEAKRTGRNRVCAVARVSGHA